jgi:hypothetical protein
VLTVSAAATLSKYSVDWTELREQLGGEFRTAAGDRRSEAQLIFLLTMGMGFLTIVALSVAIAGWYLIGIVHPTAGLIVAVAASAGVYLFEEWLIKRHQKSLTAIGVRLGEHILIAVFRPSAKERMQVEAAQAVAQTVVVLAIGGSAAVG